MGLGRRSRADRGGSHGAPPAPGAPGICALSDPERIHQLVSRAGFAPPELADVPLTYRFPSSDAYWWFLTELAGAISPILRDLGVSTRRPPAPPA